MIKRWALLICCILLLPTIAAAKMEYKLWRFLGWWSSMGVFTADRNLNVTGPFGFEFTTRNTILMPPLALAPLSATTSACPTDQAGKGISAWLWTSNGTSSTSQSETFRGLLMGTSSLWPSWAGSNIHSWEMKVSPVAGGCRSSWPARPSSGQVLTSKILAATRPLPTLGSWLRSALNISLCRSCPLGRPSVTGMSGSKPGRDQYTVLGRMAYHF